MDDRVVVQTEKAEFSITLLLGSKQQWNQNASVLCTDSSTVDGSNQEENCNKKLFANMITAIRLHITSYDELFAFIKDT